MATETKCAFRDDKDYHDKQKKILKDIDDYKLEEELSDYFIKHKPAEVKKHKKSGGGRFTGLYWRELEFKDKEKFSPYTGVQIYLYSINKNEIGDISDDVYDYNKTCVNEDIDEFPYDRGNRYRLVSDNMLIDTNTGNLIKKDNSFKYAQIWFCIDNDNDNCILGENNKNEYIRGFKNELNDVKIKDNLECRIEITKKYIGKYFKELQDQMLVSDKIFLPYNWEEKGEKNCEIIVKAINELLDARKNYLKEQRSE